MASPLDEFIGRVRRLVMDVLTQQAVPRVVWGVVSGKTGTTPPKYLFTPQGATGPIGATVLFPYLGGNAPANGETVGGLWVGTDLFLLWRQTGTS